MTDWQFVMFDAALTNGQVVCGLGVGGWGLGSWYIYIDVYIYIYI